jgi:hypothetical protein
MFIDSIESFLSSVSVIKQCHPVDSSITVCDLDKIVGVYPGERINLGVSIGEALHPQTPLARAISENKEIYVEVPGHVYGFEFTAKGLPLHDKDGNVIGGIGIAVRRQTELRTISDQILVSLSQANEGIASVTKGSVSLSEFSQQLLAQSQQANEDVKQSDQVLAIITNIADQTNLLGINAAIEAAHAGDKGRGFGIVANEIRKLSQETAASTQKIRETLQQFQKATNEIRLAIEKITAIGVEQASSTQNVSTFMEEIQEMSEKLNQFAEKL